jgi:serine protease Do
MKKSNKFLKIFVAPLAFAVCLVTFSACTFGDVYEQHQYTTVVQQNAVSVDDLWSQYQIEYPEKQYEDFMRTLNLPYLENTFDEAVKSVVSVYARFRYNGNANDVWGMGAGVICKITPTQVYVITNYHVIYDVESNRSNHRARDILLFGYGYETYQSGAYSSCPDRVTAEFVGGDIDKDIAVLRVTISPTNKFKNEIKATTFTDITKVRVLQTAVAIGNPFGEGIAGTAGYISALLRDITLEALDRPGHGITAQVFRTDTAINPGNSGGGLFNLAGELVGIVNAKTVAEGAEGMGYAIPANIVYDIVNSIVSLE